MRATRWISPTLAAGLLVAGGPLLASAQDARTAAPPRPRISNRAPAPDEVGYRPADGSVSVLNPPSFIWLHETNARSYALQWAGNPGFEGATEIAGFPWNTYTHSNVVAAGRLWWRYRFADARGRTSDWSQARMVVVATNATAFPMPSPDQQRARVPAGHPRLFLRPEDLPRLRAAAGAGEGSPDAPAGRVFRLLRRHADRLLGAAPTPEPEHLGSARDKNNAERVKYWWPNRVQTLQACEEAETLAFVHLLTGEPRYAEAARRWIRHLASWDPDGPTNFDLNCEAAKPLLHRLARAYDWAYEVLTEEEREAVRKVVARRVGDAWKSGEVGRGHGHLHRPYGSHANRTWHKIGESGIAFLGEIPEASVWLDYAVNKFFAIYPVWSDDDGGWHEGVSYWAGYQSKVVWWLQAADAALGIDGLRKPFFAQVGDFPLYVAPPGSPNMGFGDLSFGRPNKGWGGFLDYFVRAKGGQADAARARAGHWRWWAERWNMTPQDGILGFLYAARLPAPPASEPPRDLPTSKVFRGIGVASLHTTLLDSADDVHFLFKASPFGTQSHGHNAHNGFQLNAYGETLLPACTYRDLHGSRFHYEWAHATRSQNAVLVDGQGQIPHSAAPHGRIVDFRTSPSVDYVAGDATSAYGTRLRRYLRRVVFLKTPEPVLVLLDELESARPARFQFLLHGLAPFRIETEAAELTLRRTNATLRVQYLAGQPLEFRQWDGFDPAPSREFPNHWHVEASTTREQERADVLTVLAPGKGRTLALLLAERRESASAVGLHLGAPGRGRTVAFRRTGHEGVAELDGRPFDAPFAVLPDE